MKYPKGAIQSIDGLLKCEGKMIYIYSRQYARFNENFIFKNLWLNENDKFVPYQKGLRFFKSPNPYRDCRSALDCHVIPQNYNDWFVFANKDDAEAYLK